MPLAGASVQALHTEIFRAASHQARNNSPMRHCSQPSSRGKLTFVQTLPTEIFRATSHQARNSKPMSASTGRSHAENGCARASTLRLFRGSILSSFESRNNGPSWQHSQFPGRSQLTLVQALHTEIFQAASDRARNNNTIFSLVPSSRWRADLNWCTDSLHRYSEQRPIERGTTTQSSR